MKDEVKLYGAKGAVLKYVHEVDPSIPCEPFVLVPVGQDWKKYQQEINQLGESLVRSSSPLEDGMRVSFAGLFGTEHFIDSRSVERVLESTSSRDVLDYARIHGVTGPIDMGFVFQRHSSSEENWSMARHPHRKDLIFVMGRPINNPGSYSENYVFDEKKGTIQDVHDFALFHFRPEHTPKNSRNPEVAPKEIREAVDIYKKVEAMQSFQTGFTYQMEFGLYPFSFYQFRPFRKAETADWELTDKMDKKLCNKFVYLQDYAIAFGLTPPEGIRLTLARAFSRREQEHNLAKCQAILQEQTGKEGIDRCMEVWGLSAPERIYLEEYAKSLEGDGENWAGEPIDLAVGKLNGHMDREHTAVWQDNLHFYHGRDIDLSFPNAKAWMASGGTQFLSHNWFRAIQHYDIALMGGSASHYNKTGEAVRIFSDGRRALVVKE